MDEKKFSFILREIIFDTNKSELRISICLEWIFKLHWLKLISHFILKT